MNRTVFIALGCILLFATSGSAMVGGPLFTIGKQITSMTVEGTQAEMEVPIAEGESERSSMTSRRLFLIGRYGLDSMLDMDVKLGAADLTFDELGGGFSEYSSSPSLAWGVGLRAGFPSEADYQVIASLDYTGYRAEASTAKANKSISSKYLWQEITPTVAVGYKISNIVPYAGIQKPYLFGTRDYTTFFNGQVVPSASGKDSYSDGEQDIRGLFGLEYRMPDGYSLAGEVSTTSSGAWTFSVGLAQALR
ncbi:hypothetical protein KKC97_08110 [bacterium]|nr:hypothetical protein [bacterium]MBU1637612.1 hypothetical protein [bacterium]MBU1920512.1 hypothetical protein [bacterium]